MPVFSSFLREVASHVRLNVFSLRTRLWLLSFRPRYWGVKALSALVARYTDYSSLESQEELIRERRFDVLIVLDACRYDVFQQVVYEYLDGVLKPVLSPASVTMDWLKRVWGGNVWRDVIYVTASPMINKRGLLPEFDARGRFLDIVEVWDWGWSEELSTVPPDKVNLGVRMARARARLRGLRFPGDYRIVVHYVQPHAPYIALQRVISKISKHELSKEIVDIALRRLGRFTGKFSVDHILLGVLKERLSDEKLRDVMRKAYVGNLRWVLRSVADLTTHLGGKAVITADHGELLGEYGLYFHMDLPLPQLRIVPWFIVK